MLKKLLNKVKTTSENNKIILYNLVFSFFVKGLSLVVSILTTPAYIKYFNNDLTLGIWFTINSVIVWILNLDLGIGNGLRNHLSRALVEKNDTETKKYISSAYISVGFVCVVISLIFMSIFKYVDWNVIFNIKSSVVSSEAMLLTIKIMFSGIMFQMFLRLISSVLFAVQKSAVNGFIHLCTTLITLIFVLAMPSKDNDTNIITMAVVHVLAVSLPLIITTIVVFSRTELKNCIPSIKYFSIKHTKQVLSLGVMFLIVQVLYMLIMSTNEYLITLFCTSDDVVDYQIYYKPFSAFGTLFMLVLAPVWSVVTKALAEKKVDWIKTLYNRLIILAFIGMCLSFMIIPMLQFLIDIWIGEGYIKVNIWYATVFTLLSSFIMFNSVLSSFANGLGDVKTQAVCFGIGAVSKVPVAFILIHLTGSWIGVVLSNVVAIGIYILIQPIYINKFFKK